ncbi:MAG: SRPBCC family protein, partial [Myxococcota bacterium]
FVHVYPMRPAAPMGRGRRRPAASARAPIAAPDRVRRLVPLAGPASYNASMRPLVLMILLFLPSSARADDLEALLAKGPVVSVENDDKGRFQQATAVIAIERPIAEVWDIATDFASYKAFMPKVLKSDAAQVEPGESVRKAGLRQVDVNIEIEVPGSNPDYTFRYTIDDASHELKGQWLKGDLKGSYSRWRLVAAGPSRTLLYYTTASRNFSSFAQTLEDDQQTITIGVNVSAALATVKAVERRAEEKAR